MKTLAWVGVAVASAAVLGTGGYLMFRKKPETETPSGTPADQGGTGTGSGTGTTVTGLINTGINAAQTGYGAYQNLTNVPAGELIAGVIYISPRISGGVVTDPSVMEIRFNKDNAKVKVGDVIELKGTDFDGVYPVIEIWGSANSAKTAMVKKTTGLTGAVNFPNGKVYAAAKSFDGVDTLIQKSVL